MMEEAVFVCPHVVKNPENVGFYSRDPDGVFAACCQTCPNIETGNGLAFIHAKHLAVAPELLRLPINICATVGGTGTRLRYLDDLYPPEEGDEPYAPSEGDVAAAPVGSPWRRARALERVFYGIMPDGGAISATYQSGPQCIPFWGAERSARQYLASNGNADDRVRQTTLQNLRQIAAQRQIAFLAPDHGEDPMIDWLVLAND